MGDPPEWLDDGARRAWLIFAAELPWLEQADRTTLELASRIAAEMRADFSQLTGAKIGHLRACLTEMGATPAARSKVKASDDGDKDDDPAAKYLI
ncbi:MAG: hypothetical protein EBR82_76235 [Caulobacteraceae bacterium]|nr:hypothetical protein [Caulobacteraceae bacterium]